MSDQVKRYRGKALDVTFDKETCIHAAECVRGLPAVFDLEQRPWIQPDRADADAVRDVVARCPSGALQIVEHGPEAGAGAAPAGVTVEVKPGGPLIVKGGCTVRSGDRVLKQGDVVALCRCGHSANKPFCDGSHTGSGFDA